MLFGERTPLSFVLAVLFLLGTTAPRAQQWVWPLSGTSTPDIANTSFGPRLNNGKWDFHDGIDLPAPIGTPIYAVADGIVYREGPGGTDGFSSRHVNLQIEHPQDGTLYVLNLHMDTIAPGIVEGAPVTQGQLLGTVGDDGAAHAHNHFEVRKNTPWQIGSVHPLHYLPYTDTANWTAPVVDRIQHRTEGRLLRLTFNTPDKEEPDLMTVEVDLKDGASLIETRTITLDDKTTIREGNGDHYMWTNDIALEGYQRADLTGDGRTDLHQGILLRRLPANVDTVRARVIDLGGNTEDSGDMVLPAVTGYTESVDFEDGQLPPAGWSTVTSSSGTGTSLSNSNSAGNGSNFGLHATDASTTEGGSQRAAIVHSLPSDRIEWVFQGWFEPQALGLTEGQNAYLLYGLGPAGLGVAATIHNEGGDLVAGIIIKRSDSSIGSDISTTIIPLNEWHRWTLEWRSVGTRENVAVLFIDGLEVARKHWDGVTTEADTLRAGLGFTSTGATAEVYADDLLITDGGLHTLDEFAPGQVPAPGLMVALNGSDLDLSWTAGCAQAPVDYTIYEGSLDQLITNAGALSDLTEITCSTSGTTSHSFTPDSGNTIYLIAPLTGADEGSLGNDGAGQNRTPPQLLCTDQVAVACP